VQWKTQDANASSELCVLRTRRGEGNHLAYLVVAEDVALGQNLDVRDAGDLEFVRRSDAVEYGVELFPSPLSIYPLYKVNMT
jgi:hypothetical protein